MIKYTLRQPLTHLSRSAVWSTDKPVTTWACFHAIITVTEVNVFVSIYSMLTHHWANMTLPLSKLIPNSAISDQVKHVPMIYKTELRDGVSKHQYRLIQKWHRKLHFWQKPSGYNLSYQVHRKRIRGIQVDHLTRYARYSLPVPGDMTWDYHCGDPTYQYVPHPGLNPNKRHAMQPTGPTKEIQWSQPAYYVIEYQPTPPWEWDNTNTMHGHIYCM